METYIVGLRKIAYIHTLVFAYCTLSPPIGSPFQRTEGDACKLKQARGYKKRFWQMQPTYFLGEFMTDVARGDGFDGFIVKP